MDICVGEEKFNVSDPKTKNEKNKKNNQKTCRKKKNFRRKKTFYFSPIFFVGRFDEKPPYDSVDHRMDERTVP